MKKSTKVVLSLLVPAMTAYGCSERTTSVQVPTNGATSHVQSGTTFQITCSCGHSFTVSNDREEKKVQCPECGRTLIESQPHHAHNSYRSYGNYGNYGSYGSYGSNRSYRSSSPFFGWSGGNSSQSSSTAPITSSQSASSTSHAPSSSRVSFGGFGGTSARYAGGS